MSSSSSSKPLYVRTFPYLLLTAVGTMFIITSLENTALLYMNDLGFTSKQDDTFYVKTTALGLLAPPLSALALGHLANRFGAGYALMLGFRVLIAGYALIMVARVREFGFVIGYLVCCFAQSFRILRFAIISDIVPTQHRTYYMAIHQLMIPIGALLAPSVWLAVQRWRAQIVLIPSVLVLDRFAVTYIITIVVCIVLAWLAYTKLQVPRLADGSIDDSIEASQHADNVDDNTPLTSSTTTLVNNAGHNRTKSDYGAAQAVQVGTGNDASERTDSDDETSASGRVSPHVVPIYMSDGSTKEVNLMTYRNTRMAFFAVLLLCLRFTYAFVLVVFQPALINRFHADDAEVGQVFWFISVMSFVPPLMVAGLSRVAEDRQILLFGLVLKLVGYALYLPFFGGVSKWGIIIGYLLVIKASMFCVSASISLFSKVLGPFCSGQTIGLLWSFSSFFPAFVQILFSSQIMGMFATWQYAVFSAPAAIAVLMVVMRSGWQLLDPDLEYNRLVLRAAKKRAEAEVAGYR